LEEGNAKVEHPDFGERRVLSFDTNTLQWLRLLALKPTTGMGDDIPTARQDALAVLQSADAEALVDSSDPGGDVSAS
jgi:hypothetical protein